ncbi:MAG: hypothetical protein WBQ18_07270 [Solirubrobacteraceae bacterium]
MAGDLLLADAVTGGDWERGLFALMLKHPDVFEALPDYAHRALVASHTHNATHLGFRPGVLDDFLAPWIGTEGRPAYYRQNTDATRSVNAEPRTPRIRAAASTHLHVHARWVRSASSGTVCV